MCLMHAWNEALHIMLSWRNISPRFSYVTSFKCPVSCSRTSLYGPIFSAPVQTPAEVFFQPLSFLIQQERALISKLTLWQQIFAFFTRLDVRLFFYCYEVSRLIGWNWISFTYIYSIIIFSQTFSNFSIHPVL